jgi:hypothetical protein
MISDLYGLTTNLLDQSLKPWMGVTNCSMDSPKLQKNG